jgi:2-C-methyl-D-erythritol 4-phosphate cytidylyltransferase
VAGKRIRTRAENGNIVLCIGGNDRKREQPRRAVRASDQNRWLATVLEGFEDMRHRQEVALIVDEERIAEEIVAVSASRRRFVKAVDDGADRSVE